MNKLSIPTRRLSKILPIISILFASSSEAISQRTSQDTLNLLCLSEWRNITQYDTTAEKKALDSIFQEIKPCLEEFYTPKTTQSINVRTLCHQTQESLENVYMIRLEMPNMGICLGRIIGINKGISDRIIMQNTLVHELFHLNSRQELEQNKSAYRKLPINEMAQSYFVKSAKIGAKSRKEQAGIRYDISESLGVVPPTCDDISEGVENEEKEKFISYVQEEVDKIDRENYRPSSNDPDFIKQLVADIEYFSQYITLEEEIYSRSRNLQYFLFFFYGILKEDITIADIRFLAYDSRFDEKEFIMLLDGFEEEFLEYLNTIEPR